MTQIIYIEEALRYHPRVLRICERFAKNAELIYCQQYREVFNPKAQNFRLQKRNPALILAKKEGRRVLPTPAGFGIGGLKNYYFSHMLNCLYDCRYCFLQGLYQSANYVVFVNYEDFMQDIELEIKSNNAAYFFSGYDADSMAYEPVTGFVREFLPFFAKHPSATFELRTKSANMKALLKTQAIANVIVAFSFTPDEISKQVEHKVPSVAKRIASLKLLADAGWRLGLRLDPLIDTENFEGAYAGLIEQIFSAVPAKAFHSVSVGPLRFPKKMYQKLVTLYPQDKLLAEPLKPRASVYTYDEKREMSMKQFVLNYLSRYLPTTCLFECQA